MEIQTIRDDLLEKFIRAVFERNSNVKRRFLWNPVKLDDGGWNPDLAVETEILRVPDPSLRMEDFYLGHTEVLDDPILAEQEEILSKSVKLVRRQKGEDQGAPKARHLFKNEYGTYGRMGSATIEKYQTREPISTGVKVDSLYPLAVDPSSEPDRGNFGGRQFVIKPATQGTVVGTLRTVAVNAGS